MTHVWNWNKFMEKTARTMALVVFMLVLANGAAMAVAPGPEADPNDVYWDDSFVPPGMNNGNAPSDGILGMASDGFGNIYVGGDFTAVGGMVANHVAKWNGSRGPLLARPGQCSADPCRRHRRASMPGARLRRRAA